MSSHHSRFAGVPVNRGASFSRDEGLVSSENLARPGGSWAVQEASGAVGCGASAFTGPAAHTTLIHEHKVRVGGKTRVYDDFSSQADEILRSRIDRYGKAHARALEMASYLLSENRDRASALRGCGSHLAFREFYTVGEVRLVSALFCHQDRICPLCAIRRGAKLLRRYTERLLGLIKLRWKGHASLVSFTVLNGPDLRERVLHLESGLKELQRRRREKLLGRWVAWTSLEDAEAAVYSMEIKRGSGSGLWHPHVHAAVLSSGPLDEGALRREWFEVTSDSHQVDVTPFHFQLCSQREFWDQLIAGDFAEVFKYAVKFSSMSCADNWHCFKELFGRRLIRSFGAFRNKDLEVQDLRDDDLELGDLPYVLRMFEYVGGAYQERELEASTLRIQGRQAEAAARASEPAGSLQHCAAAGG